MPPIGNNQKAREFMDKAAASMTLRRTVSPNGTAVEEIEIGPTDDLVGVAYAAADLGLTLIYDGQRISVEERPQPGEPVLDPFAGETEAQ
jgi:hypothetical protein